MSTGKERTVPVLVQELVAEYEDRKMFPSVTKLKARCQDMGVALLRDGLRETIATVQSLVESLPDGGKGYNVESFTFNLGIDATGKVGLVGEIGAGCHAGISVTLMRKRSARGE